MAMPSQCTWNAAISATAVMLAVLAPAASSASAAVPIVANTWAFTNATDAAWSVLQEGHADGSAALRAVEEVLLHFRYRHAIHHTTT